MKKILFALCLLLVSCSNKVVYENVNNQNFQLVLNETYFGSVIVKRISLIGDRGSVLEIKASSTNGDLYRFRTADLAFNVRDTIFIDAAKHNGMCKGTEFEIGSFRQILPDDRSHLTTKYKQ